MILFYCNCNVVVAAARRCKSPPTLWYLHILIGHRQASTATMSSRTWIDMLVCVSIRIWTCRRRLRFCYVF